MKLKAFDSFEDTTTAVAAATSMIESKIGKQLKKFLKKSLKDSDLKDKVNLSLSTEKV